MSNLKQLTVEEAFELLVTAGGFIGGGGYTLYPGGYFAYGTFPGCMRGGPTPATLDEFREYSTRGEKTIQWHALSLHDIVAHCGYYPEMSTIFTALNQTVVPMTTDLRLEAIGLERDMLRFMIDSEYSSEDFKSGFSHERIWKQWIANRELDTRWNVLFANEDLIGDKSLACVERLKGEFLTYRNIPVSEHPDYINPKSLEQARIVGNFLRNNFDV